MSFTTNTPLKAALKNKLDMLIYICFTLQIGFNSSRVFKITTSQRGSFCIGAQHLHTLQVGCLRDEWEKNILLWYYCRHRCYIKQTLHAFRNLVMTKNSSDIQTRHGQVCPLQVGPTQVGVAQGSSSQVGHLKVDVAQIQARQICTSKVETLKNTKCHVKLIFRGTFTLEYMFYEMVMYLNQVFMS